MGLMETEENDRREVVAFQFLLERGECSGMPDRERKRVPDDGSDILKGCPWTTFGHGKSEYPRLNEERPI